MDNNKIQIKNTVSFYNNAGDSKSKMYLSLDYVLLEIIAKDERLKEQTEVVRQQPDDKTFKEEKRKLPMIAPSGVFTYRNDDIDNLREYSNILILDFDKFPDHEAANEFKEKLIQYANLLHIYAVWFSPSNKGVKVAMLHDNANPEYHYNLFMQVRFKVYPNTEQFDMKCGNISRTCFLSYDPDVWLNPERKKLTPFHFVYDPQYPNIPPRDYGSKGYSSKEFRHTEEEMRLNSIFQAQWKDKQLVNYADKHWRKDYPDSYKDGNRHKSILSRTKWLCLYGVLFDDTVDYLKSTFGRHGIDEEDIEAMAINNYNSNRDKFGSKRTEIYQRRNEGMNYNRNRWNAMGN